MVPSCERVGVVPLFVDDFLGRDLVTETLPAAEGGDLRETSDEALSAFVGEIGAELEARTGVCMRATTSTIAVLAELRRVPVEGSRDPGDGPIGKLWIDVRGALGRAVVCVPHEATERSLALVAIKNRWAKGARARRPRRRRRGEDEETRPGRDFAHCTEVMMLVLRDATVLGGAEVEAWLREVREGLRPGGGSTTPRRRGGGRRPSQGAARARDPVERMSVKFFDNGKLQSPGGVHPRTSSLALVAACDAIRAFALAKERVCQSVEDRSWRFGVTPARTYMMNVCVCVSARVSLESVIAYMNAQNRGGIVRTDNTGVNCRFARISQDLVARLTAIRRGDPEPKRTCFVPGEGRVVLPPRPFFERVLSVGREAFQTCARSRKRSPVIFFAGKREEYGPGRPWSSKLIVTGQYDHGTMMVAMAVLCHMFSTGVLAAEVPAEPRLPTIDLDAVGAPDWLASL